MSAVRRTRSLARKGLKVQRRVVLAQALFWPAVVGGAVLTIGAATLVVRRATKPDEPRAAVTDTDPAPQAL